MYAFVFPGQGSQKVGMGREQYDRFAPAAEIVDQATSILGKDLKEFCWNGPESVLTDTRNAQPALLTLGYIASEEARARKIIPSMVAGHSLGEFTALVAAQALSFEQALRLVQRRADLMAAAPPGAMAAVIGLDDQAVQTLVREISSGVLVAANYNAPGQVVISGDPAAVTAAMEEARRRGAKMAVPLPVSGAFHSPLMSEAGHEMAELIAATPMKEPLYPIYQNATACRATTVEELKTALQAQMTSPVRWVESVRAMIADGARTFIELGPGNVLSGLIRRIDKTVTVETTS